MTDYTDIVETVIRKQMETMGAPVALRQARKVPELEVDDDGTVTAVEGPGETVLREVIDVYREVSGPVAEAISEKAVRDEYGEDAVQTLQDCLG